MALILYSFVICMHMFTYTYIFIYIHMHTLCHMALHVLPQKPVEYISLSLYFEFSSATCFPWWNVSSYGAFRAWKKVFKCLPLLLHFYQLWTQRGYPAGVWKARGPVIPAEAILHQPTPVHPEWASFDQQSSLMLQLTTGAWANPAKIIWVWDK